MVGVIDDVREDVVDAVSDLERVDGRSASSDMEEFLRTLRGSWALLRRRAFHIAGSNVDPDDLLASALAAVWEKIVNGHGPSSNVVAYLTTCMRRRVIDEWRSPRAGEVPIDAPTAMPVHYDDCTRVDMHRDYGHLQGALNEIPVAQRQVLHDVVVRGMRPGDLEGAYGEDAPAISTSAYRAKKSLRSALFSQMLRRSCHGQACAPAQKKVARELWKSASIDDDSANVAQLWRCGACAEGFRAFVALTDRLAA